MGGALRGGPEISPSVSESCGVAGRFMEESGGRQEDAAPPWVPGEATAFRRFPAATASGRPPEAAPSASGNGAASRVSSLHGVRRKPVWLGLLPPWSVASSIEFMGIARK